MSNKRFSSLLVYLVATVSFFVAASTNSAFAPNAKTVTSSVGTLKGDFQVTPAGQAHYSMPIEVSPGTAGMTPALSLVYDSSSSNTRNGLLGMGFSLEGLTAITRCPSNKTQNGEIHGVDFTDKDRFCLNGEQLVAIKGEYGADGTEYRTYIDSKTKVISYGRQGNGPASFKVWTEGGQVAKYGFTADAQVKAQGKDTVAFWSLNRIQDTSGNYLDVRYFKDENQGIFYPMEVNYTGNENAKLLPYNSVKFSYEERQDKKVTYQAGSKNTLDKRLKAVQVYQSSNLVYEYRLAYEISKNTFRSRITSIQKCTGGGVCLPATKFEWQTNEEGWNEAHDFKLPDLLFDEGRAKGQLVDLNGDGLPDFVVYNLKNGVHDKNTWFNTGDHWVSNGTMVLPQPIHPEHMSDGTPYGQFIDLNGDGLPDYVIHEATNGIHDQATFLNMGERWVEVASLILPAPLHLGLGHMGNAPFYPFGQFLDLNGDGLPDFAVSVLHSGVDNRNSWFNTGNGWQKTSFILPDFLYMDSSDPGSQPATYAQLIDINGDGLPDFVINEVRANNTWTAKGVWLNTDTGWTGGALVNDGHGNNTNGDPKLHLPAALHVNNKPHGQFVDLNGDGLPDFVVQYLTGGSGGVHHKQSWFNTGNGWIESGMTLPEPLYWENKPYCELVDINGDGVPDLVLNDIRGGHQYKESWLNTGNGWEVNTNLRLPEPLHLDDTSYGQLVDINGDGLLDLVVSSVKNGKRYSSSWLNRAQKLPDYLIAITDGFGTKLSIDYEPLSGAKVKVYTKEHDAKYPNMDWQGPMYVVYQTSSSTAVNDDRISVKPNTAEHITTYQYIGAKFNHLGMGFLGFHKITTTDKVSGISTTTTYSQDINAHNKGAPIASETRLADSTLVASSSDSWKLKTFSDGKVNTTYYAPYIEQSIKKSFNLKGSLLSTTTIDNTLDDYGNPLEVVSTIREAATEQIYTTTTENTYCNNPENWHLGELIITKVSKAATGKVTQSRSSKFSYDPKTSLLMQTIAEPDDAKLALTTKYERDVFGNIIKTTVSGKGIEVRANTVKYDDAGRFVIQATNPLKQASSQLFDPRFGGVTEATDSNGLKTYYQYDDFGRQVGQVDPDGTETKISYDLNETAPLYHPTEVIGKTLKHIAYVITTHTQSSPTQREFYDLLGRKVASATQSLDGKHIWQIIHYDELGRVSRKSQPFFTEEAVYYDEMQYDELGRVVKNILPNGKSMRISYDGFTTTSINQHEQKQVKEVNALGELIKVTDNLGSVIHYKYDVYGNLITVIDSAGHKSEIEYDRLGRKIAINDPDKWLWTYEYDVLGNLTAQEAGTGEKTTFKYDKLNRVISRTDHAGTSTWEYDTADNGLGKIARINSLDLRGKGTAAQIKLTKDAENDGLTAYTRSYNYDALGRLAKVRTVIKDKSYVGKYTYDKHSRLNIEIYPNGLQVKSSYNELGYLVQLSDVQTGKVYWQLNAKDAAGHVLSETRSNGLITNYTYDPKNQFLTNINTVLSMPLALQKELLPNSTGAREAELNNGKNSCDGEKCEQQLPSSIQYEDFEYDVLGNVTNHQDLVNNSIEEFQYDDLNRLTVAKSSGRETQRLSYDALGNITFKSDLGRYKYGENGAGPHAVTSIAGKKPATFKYNENGDQIEGIIDGVKRTIIYTSYSKPSIIATPKATVSFFYNADREKFARVDKTPNKTATTYYLGNYESVTIDNGKSIITQQKAYIGPNAVHIKTADSSDSKKDITVIHEILHNNLGSVTDITDENGNVKQHFAYTPFGEQIQTKGDVPYHPVTYKGFTGHEGIEDAKLIHMDGRIYDPVVGRFLSADPYIQEPGNSQSLNRYSYCINNPLAYIDPSGFRFLGGILHSIGKFFSKPIVRIVTGMIGGIALGPLGVGWGILSSAAAGAATTAILGAVTGASFKQILFESFAAGALTYGINSMIASAQGAATAVGGKEVGVAGLGSGGAAAGEKNKGEEPLKSPGENFKDPSLDNSIRHGRSAENTSYDLNEMHRIKSDRAGKGSPVGSTEAGHTGGNYGNGASYSWCYERAGIMHNSGYSRETVMADQLLCERSQAISQTVAMFAGGVGRAVKEVGKGVTNLFRAAKTDISGIKLQKYLASVEQMGQEGRLIAGSGSKRAFRDASFISRDFGGNSGDWVKKAGSKFTARDGTSFETHWVENVNTGKRVEFKTNFVD